MTVRAVVAMEINLKNFLEHPPSGLLGMNPIISLNGNTVVLQLYFIYISLHFVAAKLESSDSPGVSCYANVMFNQILAKKQSVVK